MKMKWKRYLSVCLALTLMAAAVMTSDNIRALAAEAEVSTGAKTGEESPEQPEEKSSEKVDTSELEEKKQDTLDKIKDIKSDLSTVKNKIKELETSKSNLKSYIAKLDKEANELAAEIQKLGDDIEAKKAEIAATQEELEEAQAVADRQYEDMKTRIQFLYENGNTSYLELFLTAESMGDFLNKSSYAVQMSQYDRNMLNAYIAQKEQIEETKAMLEEEEEELNLLAEAAEEQKKTVDALIQTKTSQIQSYQSQIDSQTSEAADYQKDLEEQEKLLNQIEEQIAAAAFANGSDGDGDGGASGFIWPCPSSHRITSYFGPRPQPTPGASTNHKGIDIGAASGSAIVASAGGRVTTAQYSSSAGNYIVISHGNGMSTVYMHCSALYVSVGDVVSQGQKIAAVGSTGYSTGPHLHFVVIKNGTYVNPLNYVG